jgi:hypothetical protein
VYVCECVRECVCLCIRGLISAPSVGDDNSDSEGDLLRRVEEVM